MQRRPRQIVVRANPPTEARTALVAIIVISALAFLLFEARREVLNLLMIEEARLAVLLSRADGLLAGKERGVWVDPREAPRMQGDMADLMRQLPPLQGETTLIGRPQAEAGFKAAAVNSLHLAPGDIRSTGGHFVVRSGRLLNVETDGRAIIVASAPLSALVWALQGRLTMQFIAVGFLGALLLLVRESRLSDYSVRRLLDASPIPLVLLDSRSGILQFANQAAFGLFTDRHPQGLRDLQTELQSQSDLFNWLTGVATNEEVATREFEIHRAAEKSSWVIVSRHMFAVRGQLVTIASLADITVRHDAEAALIRAKEQAEALGRMRSESLAMISHELRTPVNGVLGLAQLLVEQPMNEPATRIVRRMMQAGKTLAAIINDLVDVAMLDVGQVRLDHRPFDPRETILAAASLASAGPARTGLDIRVRGLEALPPMLVGDPDRLQQIVFNLMGNGIKFTEAGYVDLDVDIALKEETAIELQLDIRDTGIGIPADVIPRLFQPFSQGETGTRRRFGGAGLGLAICKRLADAMGGSIILDSEIGKGSRFRVRLPFAVGDALAAAPREELRARVLVVDDVALNRDIVADLLRSEGCEVETAASGPEALAAIAASAFDIVIMDIRMPGMDGLATTVAMRTATDDGAARFPILGLTANPLPTDRPLYRLRGIDDVIEKPVDRLKLRLAIEHCLAMTHAPDIAPPPRVAHLVASLGMERAQRIVDAFVSVAQNAVELVAENCASLDFSKVEEAAHRLSGAAANIGFDDLAAAALELEDLARSGQTTRLSQTAEIVVARFKAAMRIVDALNARFREASHIQSASM